MENDKKYIFDHPENVKRLLYLLYGCCALLFILDFVILRHTTHSWENLWGFYALFGFVACVILVLIAKWMRTFLMRPEDYYAHEGRADFEENPSTENSNADLGGHDVDA